MPNLVNMLNVLLRKNVGYLTLPLIFQNTINYIKSQKFYSFNHVPLTSPSLATFTKRSVDIRATYRPGYSHWANCSVDRTGRYIKILCFSKQIFYFTVNYVLSGKSICKIYRINDDKLKKTS